MSMATHTKCFDLAGGPNLWSYPRMHDTDEQVLCNSICTAISVSFSLLTGHVSDPGHVGIRM